MAVELRVGDTVVVPWGLDEPVAATVVEVWGDPVHHVRVRLVGDAEDPGAVILVSPDVVTKSPAPAH